MSLNFLCDRPHPRFVDFDASRFVVSSARGVNLGDRQLVEGDEVPRGALRTRDLRLAYELLRVETFEHAAKLDHLREACARRGTVLEPEKVSAEQASQPEPRKKAGRR